MAYITKQQLANVLKNKPQGVTDEEVLNGLVSRGNTIEGFNEKKSLGLGTSKIGQIISGVGKAGFQTLKGAMDVSEQFLKQTAKQQYPITSAVATAGANKLGLPKESVSTQLQSLAEKKLGIEQGGAFKAQTPTEKVAKGVTEVALAFAPLGQASKATKLKSATEVKGLEKLAEYISPKLTKTERIGALKSERVVGGQVKPDTKTLKMAQDVAQFVNPKNSPEINIKNLNDAIASEGQALQEVIANKNAIFNTKTIMSVLDKVKSSTQRQLSFATDANAENAYNKVIDTFQRALKQQKNKNLSGLLQTRKDLDVALREAGIFEGKNTPIKLASRDIRNAINEYINKKVGGDEIVKTSLSKQSNYYKTLDNLVDKYETVVGKNVIERFKTLKPKTYKALKTAAQVGGGLTVYETAKNQLLK